MSRSIQPLADLRGRFLATNSAFQKMLGYTDEEIGRLTFLELTHKDYRKSNRQLVTELLEGKRRQFQIEKQYRRKDGSLIWVATTFPSFRAPRACLGS